MTSERFHKAARDNILEILKEATKKDANCRDAESMMTPTLYAAYFGHIEALRLLVARGGEPDKADYFGNTALHLAAARGHELCVRFLVNFGCNIWSLDIDRHSARDLAAINGHERILQFLDVAQADQELNNRKKSRIMKEKAERDADKRLKEFVKRQKLAEVRAEKEQRRLLKETGNAILVHPATGPTTTTTTTTATFRGRVKPPPTYSDIVGTATKRHGTGAVGRKALARRAVDDFKVVEIEVDGKRSVRSLTGVKRDSEVMYVGRLEASELLLQKHHQHQRQFHHQKADGPLLQRRGRISDVWGSLSRARSTPDLLGDRNSCCDELDEADEEEHMADDEHADRASDGSERGSGSVAVGIRRRPPSALAGKRQPGSMFNRPGFGSVAFRRSIATTLDNLPVTHVEIHRQPHSEQSYPSANHCRNNFNNNNNINNHNMNNHNNKNQGNGLNEEISIGSAGSLARRQSMWDDDLLSEEDDMDEEWTPLQRFLVANNISSIHTVLETEQIDLEALMLLTETDIAALNLPLGPRRKLLHAIASRKKALETHEATIKDIKL